MKLARFESSGVRLVTPDLVSGQRDAWRSEEAQAFISPFPRPVELAGLDAVLEEARRRFSPFDTAMDPFLAEGCHRALRLTRREAADPAPFRFLAVVHRPDAVRHRWANSSWVTARNRFWNAGTRPDSNAFSRWWWIAELTRDGDDYRLTRRVFDNSALTTAIFVRSLSFSRAFINACVEVLGDAEQDTVERAMRAVTQLLATVPLEALDAHALARELRALRAG
ncbi:MAG: DUF6339 family protein [Myxococcota bacterium]